MLKGSALRHLGRYDEAINYCREACQVPDCGYMPYLHFSAALGAAGRIEEAKLTVDKVVELQPGITINEVRQRFIGMHEKQWNKLRDGLQKAGIPE